jgi:hypothetical protein
MRTETFDPCWVSQDRIERRGVGQPCDHRDLDRTPAMSIAKPSCVTSNCLLRRKYDATFALWMMFLLGKHAMFGH